MKLVARQRRDLLDVVELVKAGVNPTQVRDYLNKYAADLVALFDELATEALNDS
jgi:chaperonin GroEL (HSP60 family)